MKKNYNEKCKVCGKSPIRNKMTAYDVPNSAKFKRMNRCMTCGAEQK